MTVEIQLDCLRLSGHQVVDREGAERVAKFQCHDHCLVIDQGDRKPSNKRSFTRSQQIPSIFNPPCLPGFSPSPLSSFTFCKRKDRRSVMTCAGSRSLRASGSKANRSRAFCCPMVGSDCEPMI